MKDIQDNILMNMAIQNTEKEAHFKVLDIYDDEAIIERATTRYKLYKKIHVEGEKI